MKKNLRFLSLMFGVLAVICLCIGIYQLNIEMRAGHEYEEIRSVAKSSVVNQTTVEAGECDASEMENTEDIVENTTTDHESETEQGSDEDVSDSSMTEEKKTAEDAEQDVSDEKNVVIEDNAEETETDVDTESKEDDKTLESRVEMIYYDSVEIPIDFQELSKINPDIYAWIEVEGTNVDYPILQHEEDNTFYIDHSVEKKKVSEGAIYTEDYNAKDFEDRNTVIYGHNMKNGSMFQTLHKFNDREFFNNHRNVTVYLPDEIRNYEIFAAYVYDSRHILQTYDFTDDKIYEYYIRTINGMRDMNAYVDKTYGLNYTDKLLTLSTCYKGIKDKRYLVQAVLVSIEKEKEGNV